MPEVKFLVRYSDGSFSVPMTRERADSQARNAPDHNGRNVTVVPCTIGGE